MLALGAGWLPPTGRPEWSSLLLALAPGPALLNQGHLETEAVRRSSPVSCLLPPFLLVRSFPVSLPSTPYPLKDIKKIIKMQEGTALTVS